MKLAYLGPPGTFTEEAARDYASQAEFIPCTSIRAVFSGVASGQADEGVVPIENSLEGSVTETLDLLIHESPLLISRELVYPVNHYLLAKPGTKAGEVKAIYSHPQALAQCRNYIESHFPHAQLLASLSTSSAVEEMLKAPWPAAAIAPRRAAEIYRVDILAHGIQDYPHNLTRFVVLAARDAPPSGRDKTSICFSFDEDRPGLLYGVLREFAEKSINLAKVESRPTRESLGRYWFLVDFEGHRLDPQIREVLRQLKAKTSLLKVFGSYPKYSS